MLCLFSYVRKPIKPIKKKRKQELYMCVDRLNIRINYIIKLLTCFCAYQMQRQNPIGKLYD